MVQGKLLDKQAFVMRIHQATASHPENGEKIDISLSGVNTTITYKGRIVTFNIQEMINEAVELIDREGGE